jgi:hypothetical protein
MDATALRRLANRLDEEWSDDPNVISVGYGVKVVDDEHAEGPALRFVVREKFDDEDEIRDAGSDPIPDTIEGVPTDVIVNDAAALASPVGDRGTTEEEPLRGGVSTAPVGDFIPNPTGFGTLGGLCYHDVDGEEKLMALSNAHVWGHDIGTEIMQPYRPAGEFAEASVKLLTCGPLISYISEGETPSGLTSVLATAAAAAGIAAAASDHKDPHRRGQEATEPATSDERTLSERVSLTADPNDLPLPGTPYTFDVEWDYARETDAQTYTHDVKEERPNEHVLVRQHVWTERDEYEPGETVDVRGLVETTRAERADEFHVVAHLVPEDDPSRRETRVLCPTECERAPFECLTFGPEHREALSDLPFDSGGFRVESQTGVTVQDGRPPLTAEREDLVLGFPSEGIDISIPRSNRAWVRVIGFAGGEIRLEGFDDDGDLVDSDSTQRAVDRPHRLTVTGNDLTDLRLSGGGNEAMLSMVCVQEGEATPISSCKDRSSVFCYGGEFTLDTSEDAGNWQALLSVQTVDTTTPETPPTEAARTIGGIEEAQLATSTVMPAACGIVLLLDDVFDVI